jgi:hypothetical protein
MGSGWEYQVRVEGKIGPRWLAWFDGLTICVADEAHTGRPGESSVTTTLTGVLPDQAALAGLLQKLYTLGLPLLEVRRSEPGSVENPVCDQGMSELGISIRKADDEWRRGG